MEFVDLIPTPKLDVLLRTQTASEGVEGTLCLTSHHLIFSTRRDDFQELLVSTPRASSRRMGYYKERA